VNEQNMKEQKYLKLPGLIALLTLLHMVAPMCTDLYLPALPGVRSAFGISQGTASLTMSLFFAATAFGCMIFGPISDKIGRKPVLLASCIASTICAFLCGLTNDIAVLMIARVIHGLGGGGMMSMGTCIIRDSFDDGPIRTKVISVSSAISAIAPIMAPILGAWILSFSNWQGEFYTLGIMMVICTIGAFLYQETLPKEERVSGNLGKTLEGCLVYLKQPKFMLLVLMVAILSRLNKRPSTEPL